MSTAPTSPVDGDIWYDGTKITAADYEGMWKALHTAEGTDYQIVAANGLLLVSPEYNNSVPGVFKNAIDWLSRPPADIPRVFAGRPIGIVGATPGPGGTTLMQEAWLPVVRALGMVPFFSTKLMVANAGKVFDAGGQLHDAAVRAQVDKYIAEFARFVARVL